MEAVTGRRVSRHGLIAFASSLVAGQKARLAASLAAEGQTLPLDELRAIHAAKTGS